MFAVSQYFNARYMVIPLIHVKQFHRQYEKFWQDPVNANVMWTSIFFSICCLSATLSLMTQSPQAHDDDRYTRESFQTAASQCLLLGNYSKPQKFVVEALSLFLQCRIASSLNAQTDVLLIFAVQSRLAFMMELNRDGSNHPHQYSPFEVEMRRRVWSMIVNFDILSSCQRGIPTTIMPDSWDTKPPSNLMDTDFDEDTTELPPARPETDVTPILYFTVKSRIIYVYTRICQHSLTFSSYNTTAETLMKLDVQLREQAAKIPKPLCIKPIRESVTDAAHEVMSRLNISFLWRKALCVLHRKHMTLENDEYSFETCLESSASMCSSLIDLYPEFQPGGLYANDTWSKSVRRILPSNGTPFML